MSDNTLLPLFLFFLFLSNTAFGQLHLKLELMSDSTKWGVYVKPQNNINPSPNTITGSGQITLVIPTGYEIGQMENVHGTWDANARIFAPIENPTKDYLSFGLVQDFPKITLKNEEETLLFTIERISDCPSELYLIENQTDPFANLPNSIGVNPGNDLGIFDSNVNLIYNWVGNYDMCAWSCLPCNDISSNTEIELTDLEIFPNPSNGTFKIDLGKHVKTIDKIKIFNTIGNQIYQNDKIEVLMKMDLDLAKGLYFVAFEKENQVLRTQRIIISK